MGNPAFYLQGARHGSPPLNGPTATASLIRSPLGRSVHNDRSGKPILYRPTEYPSPNRLTGRGEQLHADYGVAATADGVGLLTAAGVGFLCSANPERVRTMVLGRCDGYTTAKRSDIECERVYRLFEVSQYPDPMGSDSLRPGLAVPFFTSSVLLGYLSSQFKSQHPLPILSNQILNLSIILDSMCPSHSCRDIRPRESRRKRNGLSVRDFPLILL